jgi:clan AA aspartic protease (TIGR02281 family)
VKEREIKGSSMVNSAKQYLALGLLLIAPGILYAQDSGIHKCVASDGSVTYQQDDCPTGTTGKTVTYGSTTATTLTLAPNLNHQHSTTLTVNGVTVSAYVDTGATYVTISTDLAQRMKISSDNVKMQYMQTANGVIAAGHKSVGVLKVGSFELYNVDVAIVPNAPTLIGMSALSKLSFTSENGNLVLSKH